MGPPEAAALTPSSLLNLLFPSRVQSDLATGSSQAVDSWPLVLLILLAAVAAVFVGAAFFLSKSRSGSVQAVFFIHRDGRLVHHFASREIVVDPVIFSGMLTALEAFVHDSVAEGTGPLRELKFSGRSVLLERGRDLLAVAVCDGSAPTDVGPRLRWCIASFENGDQPSLQAWDGTQVRVPDSVESTMTRLIGPDTSATGTFVA
ncbi:MAG TPA: hypothetical protein VI893_09450 [Thermoplasmata archaeon]|nr:hypothetical protein [Thermoplasmata archaeon]